MAFTIPSIADLGTRLKNAFRANLPGTDAWIEPNNLSVIGKVFALVTFEVYQRLQYLYRQFFASTADSYHLEFRHGYEYGITRKASTAAFGYVDLTQTTPVPNTVLPAGIRLLRGDGISYLTTDAAVMNGGLATVPVRAEQSGATTNLAAGATLTVEQSSVTTNLVADVVVSDGGLGGGADAETDDQLRSRILYRKRNPPHGGAASDYVIWATSIPGCTRAYISPFSNSPGAVTIYPLFDDTRENGIPTGGDLEAISTYIGAQGVEGVRPVTARIYVVAPVASEVDVTIANLSNDAATTRSAILQQLAAMFRERVVVSTVAEPFTLPVSWISEAISRATGENRHTLIAPSADIVIGTGQIPVLGTVMFT